MPSDPPSSDRPARQPPVRKQANICEERARLLHSYSAAARTYADRVETLSDLIASGSEQSLGDARRNCRTAWDEVEKSRLALYRHEADHQCDRGAEIPSDLPACGH